MSERSVKKLLRTCLDTLFDVGDHETETPQNPLGCSPLDYEALDMTIRSMSVTIKSAPRRTRTYNPLIKSQLLCQLS
jgi:hypothetical protein